MGSGNSPTGIIARINRNAAEITEEEIDQWIVPELLKHYSGKISSLSSYVYYGSIVGQKAFLEEARETLKKGSETFLFKSQHWRSRRSIDPYLLTCLNRLADKLKTEADSQKKVSVPICPGCRALNGSKEFLNYDGKFLRCTNCEQESNRIEDVKDPTSRDQYELRVRNIFLHHSRKGYRCPKCERFIPHSYVKEYGVSCPYDCSWFGTINELGDMLHPLGLSSDCTISLNRMIGDHDTMEWQSCFGSNDANADIRIEIIQQYEVEHETVSEVLETQMSRVLEEPREKVIKKVLMYQAYKNMLERYPEDMIRYLAHRKSIGEMPIQSQIFQEFVRLINNAMPFTIRKFGWDIEIYSLLDPNLDLFSGISEYETKVADGGIVPNRTEENYIGGREFHDHGPCFIGWLCELVDHNGDSLMDNVIRYTFSHIRLRGIRSGTKVKVTHMRIPSHYEMNGMVQLQRIRRRIVDSVYQRLHGKRREIGKRNEVGKTVS
jgi:hypothetical protein